MAGTAPTAAAFVAIGWPRPRWHAEDASRSEGLPAELRALEEREARAGRKLGLRVFQRAAGASRTDRVEILFWARARGLEAARDVAIGEAAGRIERWLAGERAGEPVETPLVLVCSDGRHDRCCAAHGRAFAEALRAEAARRASPIEVAESSHLGGHRFAATCVVLPAGRMYGRLAPADSAPLLDSIAADRTWAARYRGRLGEPEPLQVADAYLAARFGDAPAKLDPVAPSEKDALSIEARIQTNGAEQHLLLDCERRTFRGPTSCDEPPADATRPRWILSRVHPLRRRPRPNGDGL
jgi:hypothetical protein